jgi:hypothetical protein
MPLRADIATHWGNTLDASVQIALVAVELAKLKDTQPTDELENAAELINSAFDLLTNRTRTA